jgi:hypothetical protein
VSSGATRGAGNHASWFGRGSRGSKTSRARWRWLRLALGGAAASWLAVLMLALPLVAHGAPTALASYGASASGWAIQPYIENDEFINIPATDQTAPYVYVAIDQNPSADAKAAYFTPGTAINAALGTNSVPYQVPSGVEARYPGQSPASSQAGVFNDGVATQAAAGSQAAQAQEAYAQAAAAVASYQFAPPPGLAPGGGGVPPLPTLPPLPTVPPLPGSSPTATPAGGHPTPTPTHSSNSTPTATPCPLGVCLTPIAAPQAARPAQTAQAGPAPVTLPDALEKQLQAALRAAEAANPQALKISGVKLAAMDPTLPYAQADVSGQAVAQASDSGVVVTVVTRAAHVELFQGLITFATIETTLSGEAPATPAPGKGQLATRITGMTIAGIPVTLDQNGVTVADQNGLSGAQIATLSKALNGALAAAGIQIGLVKTTSASDSQKWEGSGGGVQVTAAFDAAPGSVPATHINFTLGMATASLYALGGGSGFDNSGGGGVGGFFGGFFGSPPGGGGAPGSSGGGGSVRFPGSLTPGELLALLFIVQGVSTAAAAATARQADAIQHLSQPPAEEETI